MSEHTTKPKALAQFMLSQFKCSEDARQWMIAWAWMLESIGEVSRAWMWKRAAGHLAVRSN